MMDPFLEWHSKWNMHIPVVASDDNEDLPKDKESEFRGTAEAEVQDFFETVNCRAEREVYFIR